jgi:hypothetical protein
MEQFKIKQGGFKEIRKTLLIITVPLLLIITFGVLAIFYFTMKDEQRDVNVLLLLIPFTLVTGAFGLYPSMNRQKKIFESYSLTLDNNSITREQHNTPTITISNEEISEIIKNSNGSITIKGNSKVNVIGVPPQIDDYKKLEELLNEIKQISTKTKESFPQKYIMLFSLLGMGLMATFQISNIKIIVGISGLVLLTFLGYSFFAIQRSKNIDNKTKRGRWMILFVAAIIIGGMYYKLSGLQ